MPIDVNVKIYQEHTVDRVPSCSDFEHTQPRIFASGKPFNLIGQARDEQLSRCQADK